MRSPIDREVDCALCVKKVLACAKRVNVCRELGLLKYTEEDAGVDKCEEEVRVKRGCAMVSRGGFGRVASPRH